jgi:hypothetical protein
LFTMASLCLAASSSGGEGEFVRGAGWQRAMGEIPPSQNEIDQFILDRVESVPHLEALLLVWRNRPQTWTVGQLAQRLFVEPEVVKKIMDDLVREQLLVVESKVSEQYCYPKESESSDRLIQAVDQTYRRELVRVSNLIHSKPSAGIREFARAFRFSKERE